MKSVLRPAWRRFRRRVTFWVYGMWQPIDQAPRDGSPCLGHLLGGTWCIMRWQPETPGWYQAADSHGAAGSRVYPTHFLAVPSLQDSIVRERAGGAAPPRQTFRVYRLQAGDPADARSVEAADPYAAALAFQAALAHVAADQEIVVISPNGVESVFGYRQTVPVAHLDD